MSLKVFLSITQNRLLLLKMLKYKDINHLCIKAFDHKIHLYIHNIFGYFLIL